MIVMGKTHSWLAVCKSKWVEQSALLQTSSSSIIILVLHRCRFVLLFSMCFPSFFVLFCLLLLFAIYLLCMNWNGLEGSKTPRLNPRIIFLHHSVSSLLLIKDRDGNKNRTTVSVSHQWTLCGCVADENHKNDVCSAHKNIISFPAALMDRGCGETLVGRIHASSS